MWQNMTKCDLLSSPWQGIPGAGGRPGKTEKSKKKISFLISQNFDFSDAMQVRLELLIKMWTFSKLGLTNS